MLLLLLLIPLFSLGLMFFVTQINAYENKVNKLEQKLHKVFLEGFFIETEVIMKKFFVHHKNDIGGDPENKEDKRVFFLIVNKIKEQIPEVTIKAQVELKNSENTYVIEATYKNIAEKRRYIIRNDSFIRVDYDYNNQKEKFNFETKD